PWFMHHDDEIERYRIPVDEYIRRSIENLEEYEQTRRSLADGAPIPVEGEGELAPRYIHSFVTGERRLEYGNVRNDGLIDDLPQGCCVEVPCWVDGDGVHSIEVGELPRECRPGVVAYRVLLYLMVRVALDVGRLHLQRV